MSKHIEGAWATVISTLGYPSDDPHLIGSPDRVGKFMRTWHTQGLPPPDITDFDSAGYDELVLVDGIAFHSLCAHHALPFFGVAAVGYIPTGRVIGLSKIARVVDHFARRFQVQENLSREVADYLEEKLSPAGLGVVLRAEHMCMSMRGIQKPGHQTTTSCMRGAFRKEPSARAEFLSLIGTRK